MPEPTAPFSRGDRVKVMPHTDLFMMGETQGTVIKVGRKYITVRGFRSGRNFRFTLNTDCLERTGDRDALHT